MKTKNKKKRLDARIAGFYKSIENMQKRGLEPSGYKCPGSNNK